MRMLYIHVYININNRRQKQCDVLKNAFLHDGEPLTKRSSWPPMAMVGTPSCSIKMNTRICTDYISTTNNNNNNIGTPTRRGTTMDDEEEEEEDAPLPLLLPSVVVVISDDDDEGGALI